MSKALSNKKKLNDFVDVVADYGADPTGVADSTTAIQNALNSGRSVFIPQGNYKITATLKTTASGQCVRGEGRHGMTILTWAGAANTAMWATNSSTLQVSVCITDMEFISLLVDGFRGVDYTNYCYSTFARLYIQTYGSNCYGTYGTGRSGGDGPYYNVFDQIDFSSNNIGGVTTGSAGHYGDRLLISTVNWNGPNANRYYGGRVSGSSHVAWFLDGIGNVFDSIVGESITVAHYELGSNTADYTGTFTSGSINQAVNSGAPFAATTTLVGGAVTITSGTGSTALVPTRSIINASTTTLTIDPYWAIVPDATSAYAVYAPGCQGNAIVNPYCEGNVSSNPAFLLERPGTSGTELRGGWLVSLGSGLPVNKKVLHANDHYSPIGWKDPIVLTFSKTNIAASLTDSALVLSGTARQTALPAGKFQVLGWDILFSNTITAGTCDISLTGNGLKLPSGAYVSRCDTSTTANNGGSFRQDYFPPGTIVAAGTQNQLGVTVTTSAGFLPSGSMDLVVQVYVQLT